MTPHVATRAGGRLAAIPIASILGAIVLWNAPIPGVNQSPAATTSRPPVLTLPGETVVSDMNNLIGRPLFTPNRRPWPVPRDRLPSPVSPRVQPTIDGMTLLGLVRSPGRNVALVAVTGAARPVQVKPGDTLREWVVKQVLADRLILQSAKVDGELVLARPSRQMGVNPTDSFPPPLPHPAFGP